MEKRLCIIVDVDGTLANTDHRQHHLVQQPKNWDGWLAAADHDTAHADVMAIVSALSQHNVAIIICSQLAEAWRLDRNPWAQIITRDRETGERRIAR